MLPVYTWHGMAREYAIDPSIEYVSHSHRSQHAWDNHHGHVGCSIHDVRLSALIKGSIPLLNAGSMHARAHPHASGWCNARMQMQASINCSKMTAHCLICQCNAYRLFDTDYHLSISLTSASPAAPLTLKGMLSAFKDVTNLDTNVTTTTTEVGG